MRRPILYTAILYVIGMVITQAIICWSGTGIAVHGQCIQESYVYTLMWPLFLVLRVIHVFVNNSWTFGLVFLGLAFLAWWIWPKHRPTSTVKK